MSYVKLEVKDHIGFITIDKPPVNTFNSQTYYEIGQRFKEASENKDVWVVILSSTGKVFCAGNDVSEFKGTLSAEANRKYADTIAEYKNNVYNCRKPVIVAVQGKALGAGCGLVTMCDLVVAAEEAGFALPEIRVGYIGGGAASAMFLPRNASRYMSLTGSLISASEMYRYGNIHKVVPKDELMNEAINLAHELMQNAPYALELLKCAMNENENARINEKYDVEVKYGGLFSTTKDKAEAINAFMEKRKPNYTNE